MASKWTGVVIGRPLAGSYGVDVAPVAVVRHCGPNTDLVIAAKLVSNLHTKLAQVDVHIVVVSQEVVGDAPVHSTIESLERAKSSEALESMVVTRELRALEVRPRGRRAKLNA